MIKKQPIGCFFWWIGRKKLSLLGLQAGSSVLEYWYNLFIMAVLLASRDDQPYDH